MENANGSPVHLANRTIDSKRSLKVIIVGAGISGIISAIKLQEAISNLEIVIYDKNPGIGGKFRWAEGCPKTALAVVATHGALGSSE